MVLSVVQNTALVLQMRYTRVQEGDRYFTSTAVIMSELVKVLCCLGVISYQEGHTQLKKQIFGEGFLKVAIPAGIYAVQNNLLYYGLSNLEAPVYQVSNQLKIFTTAIFFVLILHQSLSSKKWFSLFLLFAGVSMVQISALKPSSSPVASAHKQNPLLGGLAVFLASVTSGFAGVYIEKIMKTSSLSVWVRNCQMGLFGFLFAGLIVLISDHSEIFEKGFFFGWNSNVVLLVLNHALGGLIIGVLVRYGDNIIKGFASALSIIFSSLFSVFLFDFTITTMFVGGAAMVCMAVYIYQQNDKPKQESAKNIV
uniref:UDP-galactose transporter n=1 Tax=Arcella intermedia TaxID=1963864 RepID=A0A6B2LBF1_9EUKA